MSGKELSGGQIKDVFYGLQGNEIYTRAEAAMLYKQDPDLGRT